VEVQVAKSPLRPRHSPSALGSVIEVRLGNGRSLMVAPEFDASHFRALLATGATDMRCGFDRLAERVRVVIGQDPLSGSLFVFRWRCGDRLKILVWDRDGFLLWYKRLETSVFKLPRVPEGARSVEIRTSELAMVLDGIDVSKLKRVPRYTRISKENKDKDIAVRDSQALLYSKHTRGRQAQRSTARPRITASDSVCADCGTR